MLRAIKKIILFIAAGVVFVVVAVFGAGGKKAADIAFGKFYEGKTSAQKGDGKNDIMLGASVFMSMNYDTVAPEQPAYAVTGESEGTEYSFSAVDSDGVVTSVFDDRNYEFKTYTFTDTSELSEGDTVVGGITRVEMPTAAIEPDDVPDGGTYEKIAYYSSADGGFADGAVTEYGDDGNLTVQCEFGFAGADYFTRD